MRNSWHTHLNSIVRRDTRQTVEVAQATGTMASAARAFVIKPGHISGGLPGRKTR